MKKKVSFLEAIIILLLLLIILGISVIKFGLMLPTAIPSF